MTLQVSCPHCGSEALAHVERALVAYRVASFARNDAGELYAVSFKGDPDPDWRHAERVDFPWRCEQCKAALTGADLSVKEVVRVH